MKASTLLSIIAVILATAPLFGSQARDFVKGAQERSYSKAVITHGGTIIWLAGQGGLTDDNGNSLAGNFDAQARQAFKNISATLAKAGGKLSDLVQMTVFIRDPRDGDRLTEIRKEVLGDNFPGSALITISGLANPESRLEIQAVAVVGDN